MGQHVYLFVFPILRQSIFLDISLISAITRRRLGSRKIGIVSKQRHKNPLNQPVISTSTCLYRGHMKKAHWPRRVCGNPAGSPKGLGSRFQTFPFQFAFSALTFICCDLTQGVGAVALLQWAGGKTFHSFLRMENRSPTEASDSPPAAHQLQAAFEGTNNHWRNPPKDNMYCY